MIMLKPNGLPLYRKLVTRYTVFLLAILLSMLWLQPLVYAEPVDDLEVEGGTENSGAPVIHKISHRAEGDTDIFTFAYRGELPETVFEMATDGLWMIIEGCGVELPPGSEGKFSTPVQGELIDRLDVSLDEETSILRIGLISFSGARFSYDINAPKDGEFEIICFKTSQLPEVEVEPVIEVPDEEPASEELSEPEIKEVYSPPAAGDHARIVKVRYDPVGEIDRFTFIIEGPMPGVEVFSLKYPDRLNVNVSPAEVDLPAHSGDRFESPVPGIGVVNMVAVNNVLEDMANAGFTFSVNSLRAIDDLEIKVDTSLPGKIIIDVVNLPLGEPEIIEEMPAAIAETPAVEETAPEEPEQPTEMSEEPMTRVTMAEEPSPVEGEPVGEEVVVTEIEVVPEPEPVVPVVEEPAEPEPSFGDPFEIEVEREPERPEPVSLSVNITPCGDGGVVVRIEGDKPFGEPRIKTMGYPTRISLTLPFASIDFEGDRSGDWDVDEGPISKLRAGEYVIDDEHSSSLFVYVAGNVDPGNVTAEIEPAGPMAYDINIDVMQEPELPVIVAEAPVTEPEEPAAVEPIAEPDEITEPPETIIEIEVESYIAPTPPFIAPVEPEVTEPEVAEEPAVVEEPAIELEPAIEEEPAVETIGIIEPLHTPEERPLLERYPKFSLDCQPGMNGRDRFIFEFDGTVREPVVKRFNHPPRVMFVIADFVPDTKSVNPYDYIQVSGGVVANRFKLSCVEDGDSVKTVVEIDTPMLGSPDDIGVEIDVQGNRLVVNVFERTGGVEPAFLEEPAAHWETLRLDEFGEESPEPETLTGEEEEISADEPMVQQFQVKDANIVDILQIICIEAEISNIIDPSVTGRISLALQEPMPLSTLLDLLGNQVGFSYYVKDGVYFFAHERVLEARFPEFYSTYLIEMNYADPNQVRMILGSQGIILSENMVIYNPVNIGQSGLTMFTTMRQLIIRGSERDIRLALSVIKALDIPPVQILYDVKVIQTSGNIRETSGIAWLTGTDVAENIGAFSFSMDEYQLPAPGDVLPQGFIRNTMQFSATINYLNQRGEAKLLANPTISALNGQSATYFVGQEIPYRSTFQVSDIGRVTQRVANQQVGITLNITGFAASDGMVTMFVAPEISNLLELTDIGPRTSRNNFATTMRVADGETYIIAGLINEENRTSQNKVPILGDLPIFGQLFKSKKTDIDRSELIITITPHIIKPTEYKGPKVSRVSEYEDIFQGRYRG